MRATSAATGASTTAAVVTSSGARRSPVSGTGRPDQNRCRELAQEVQNVVIESWAAWQLWGVPD